jgi:hypothetical protein
MLVGNRMFCYMVTNVWYLPLEPYVREVSKLPLYNKAEDSTTKCLVLHQREGCVIEILLQ